ncbi:hypothetical protein [Granulicella aggregans]|uniref:hypothetical protein n=1 Tax=Granulicella aggregans TaxID=474949 RepID=UPI0021E00C6F|nr:hypothetical protein [Granulicella aggregans]
MDPTHVVVTSGNEVGEWARKIIEVYMTWYTFFASSNVLAMGWIFGSEIDQSVRPMLKPICILFAILNVLGAISTGVVGSSVGPQIPEFKKLIYWAAGANGFALLGFVVVWWVCYKRLSAPLPAAILARPGATININSAGNTVINN